jgi:hypothetical protein
MIKKLFVTDILIDNFLEYDRLPELTTELLINNSGNEENDLVDSINLFDCNLPELENFKNSIIIPSFKKYLKEIFNIADFEGRFKSWSWISNKGNMNVHNHSGAHISGIFYILTDNKNGKLKFHDPRVNANRGYNVRREFSKYFMDETIVPNTGDYIIFPSYLYHSVVEVNNTRISLPVDLYINHV